MSIWLLFETLKIVLLCLRVGLKHQFLIKGPGGRERMRMNEFDVSVRLTRRRIIMAEVLANVEGEGEETLHSTVMRTNDPTATTKN